MCRNKPEIYFILLILLFGILLILITPIGANTDEETYVARIWEMSSRHVLPNSYLSQGPFLPSAFLQLSYRQQVNLPVINFETWVRQSGEHIDWSNMINYHTRAIYFPTLFLIQAFIMGIVGRVFDFPVMLIFYLLRFSYLLIYIALVYLSIKFIPIGKWLLGALAVIPTSLIQASAISTDSVNIGISLLFFAWTLKIAQSTTVISKRDFIFTCLLILSLFTLKPNMLLLLILLILVPFKLIGTAWRKIAFLFVVILGFLVLVGYYHIITTSSTQVTVNVLDPFDQLLSFFTKPTLFFFSFINTLRNDGLSLLIHSIGMTGYNYWPIPSIVYWLTSLILILALFFETEKQNNYFRKRVVFFILAVIFIFSIFFTFYLLETPPGSFKILGLQGRYLTPIIPLLVFAVCYFPPNKNQRFTSIYQVLLLGNLVILTWSLFMVYHVQCGNSWYKLEICTLPHYKNWAPESNLDFQAINNSRSEQTFTAKCDRLTQLNLWVNSNDQTATGLFTISLLNDNEDILYSDVFTNSEIPGQGWFTVIFPQINDSSNKEYKFSITGNLTVKDQNTNFAYTMTDEYPEGSLLIDDQSLIGDMVFQYGCNAGLNQVINPQ